jgi:hypothetical protein
VRVALVARSAGRAPVAAPLIGAIGTGALIVIAGPFVNLKVAP